MASVLTPLLHLLPPEAAHGLGIWALRAGLVPSTHRAADPALRMQAFGLEFAHPLGLAAGFDKNAVAINALLGQGFAFVEAGTVTPLPQGGNPRPRIFRLYEDKAVINRLGFNNDGLTEFVQHLAASDRSRGIRGANIGKNKDAADSIADYISGVRAVYPYADYITVNISSPNTPGLRDLQQREALGALLEALQAVRQECTRQYGMQVPLLLKVAPDLGPGEKEDVAFNVLEHGIDGLIVGNTTVSRPDSLRSAHRSKQGGLSGRPLFALSNECLSDFYRMVGHRIPLIGVGGISSAHDAYIKIRSGATLLQLYTAIVYQGFGAVRRICKGLPALMKRDGFTQLSQAIGADVN